MGIPRELRNKIYKMLLVKKDAVHIQFPKYRFHGIHWRGTPGKVKRMAGGPLHIGPKYTTSILTVNKQAAAEGTDILYGYNKFTSDDATAVATVFVNGKKDDWTGDTGIGRVNAAKIKRAMFEIPTTIINEFIHNLAEAPTHGEFLDFVCQQLSGLQNLELKTTMTEEVPQSFETALSVESQQKLYIVSLLKTVARVTKYHPNLRKAIWSRWSGYGLEEGEESDDYCTWPVDWIRGHWSVDLVPAGPGSTLKGETKINKDAFGIKFESTVSLLTHLQHHRVAN